MKKAIRVKGSIKIDRKEMKQIRAGETCAQYGVVCNSVFAKPQQKVLEGRAVADKLWLG